MAEARKAFDKQIQSKLDTGYVRAGHPSTGLPPPPPPRPAAPAPGPAATAAAAAAPAGPPPGASAREATLLRAAHRRRSAPDGGSAAPRCARSLGRWSASSGAWASCASVPPSPSSCPCWRGPLRCARTASPRRSGDWARPSPCQRSGGCMETRALRTWCAASPPRRCSSSPTRPPAPSSARTYWASCPRRCATRLRRGNGEGFGQALDKYLAAGGKEPYSVLETVYLVDSPVTRPALLRVLRTAPFQRSVVKALRHVFKMAEYRRDGEVFGLIAWRYEKERSTNRSCARWVREVHAPVPAPPHLAHAAAPGPDRGSRLREDGRGRAAGLQRRGRRPGAHDDQGLRPQPRGAPLGGLRSVLGLQPPAARAQPAPRGRGPQARVLREVEASANEESREREESFPDAVGPHSAGADAPAGREPLRSRAHVRRSRAALDARVPRPARCGRRGDAAGEALRPHGAARPGSRRRSG